MPTSDVTGHPFQAEVGIASGNFATLAEAVDWATSTAEARDVLLSTEPLPTDTQLADQTFLAARGLTA
jgi:hypothetical protein